MDGGRGKGRRGSGRRKWWKGVVVIKEGRGI